MSTPITFSGFNDIDFNVVLTALMAQASQPLTTLQTRHQALQSQTTGFDTLAGFVSTLRSAANALGEPATLAMLAGRSADPSAVAVAIDASAAAGAWDIVVNELARAQVTVSTNGPADANTTVVASGGSITIGGVAVAVAGDVTLQQLAAAINATEGIGVSAGVIRTGTSAYRLALTSRQSGAEQAFTITNGLTGGSGLAFADTDANGVSGDSAADNAVAATDASLLVNNILVTGSDNTFADLMPGVTITALKKAPAAPVRVAVEADTANLKTQVLAFVTAYNALAAFAGEQRSAAARGDATSIGREPVLRSLQLGLRGALLGAHGAGSLTRLAEAGIEFVSTGQIRLKESVFDAAAAADAGAVRELFGGTGGAFVGVEALLDAYESADGYILAGKRRLEQQIATMDGQIEAMQRRLALERDALQRQFSEADRILSRLKSQATALSSFGSVFGSMS